MIRIRVRELPDGRPFMVFDRWGDLLGNEHAKADWLSAVARLTALGVVVVSFRDEVELEDS